MSTKKFLELIGQIYRENYNDPNRQIKEYKKLLAKAHKAENLLIIGVIYQMLSVAYNLLGDRENLFSCAIRSVNTLKQTNDHKMLASAYTALGVAYFDNENFQLALSYYDKAYDLFRKHRVKGPGRRAVMNNLATVYTVMGDYKSGIPYLEAILEDTRKETPDNTLELMIYSLNLADSYIHIEEYDTALQILADAESWSKAEANKPYVCGYLLKCVIAYYHVNKTKQGNEKLKEAIRLAKESPDSYSVYDDFRELTHFLLQKGDIKRAEELVELIRDYGGRNPKAMDQLLVNDAIAAYYKTIGDFEQAVEHYERLGEFYKTRNDELKRIQLNIHKGMKEADSSIAKLNRIIAESEERANREPLTKLLNRSAILRVSEAFIETAARKKEKIGAIFIDIDFFKECNDTYGHAKGDEIIKEVAEACMKEESDRIRFARYGGDEFLGLTRGLDDIDVTNIARRISDRIRNSAIPNIKNPNGRIVTLSVGVVNVPITDKTDSVIRIVNYADKAVYHAKSAGKNCIYLLTHDTTGNGEAKDPFERIDF